MPETVFCYDDYFLRYGKLNIFLLSPPEICLIILSFLIQSGLSHLAHHMCNIAAFAGTKLRLQFGDFSQGRTPYFAELFLIFKNAIFHSIFVIWTNFFQVSTPLDVLFRTDCKKYAY